MPPEPLPCDRKDFFKERKEDRSSEHVGSLSKWRENPHHGSSSRESARWGAAEFRSRPPGNGKQGGWPTYSQQSSHAFTPSRSNEKIMGEESHQSSRSRADGKCSWNIKENWGSFTLKDWQGGHSWDNGSSLNVPDMPHCSSDQRSVDDMLPYNSHPHSDFVNTWDQLHFKDQHNKTGSANGMGTGQRSERENSLGSIDLKPRKWIRSGSLSSRGSAFSHSSSSKSTGVYSGEAKVELQLGNFAPVQFPAGDAGACATSAAPSAETSSRKKPRLGWGEGLAKYEKKKDEGPDDGATKHGMVVCVNTEPFHSHFSNLSDNSPRFTGLSERSSPATPSSAACSSSPGVEDKPTAKAVNIDNDTSKLSGSPSLLSENHVEGIAFNLQKLEATPISNLSSSLGELLQSLNPGSVTSSFFDRSTAVNKLLVCKGDILKALEMTESEIELLENELNLTSDSRNSWPCLLGSSSLLGECQAKPFKELVVTSTVSLQPAPLQLVCSGVMIAGRSLGGLEEEHCRLKDEDIGTPATVTSKFVEPLSLALSESVKHGVSNGDWDASISRNQVNCSVYASNEEKIEGLSASESGGQLLASKSCAASVGWSLHSDRKDILCDLILASNKASSNRASEVFKKLLPSHRCHIDTLSTTNVCIWPNDPLIMEKFAMRKKFLRFKQRVITLKFRAFQHLWKEDMRLLSIRKHRAKSQKRWELSFHVPNNGYQKHRSSIRSRFSSPAGNSIPVPTTEVNNFISKLLSDSEVKLYRNSLKMPALILDKKEKMIRRFISSNGLVEDPFAIEKERVMINPWTTEEKEIFMDKLATFGKEFRKIASFLDHKTTADCIEFYYKNHKSDCFVNIRKKPEFAKRGKLCFTNNYLVTYRKRWNHETNAVSLDMLGATIAANARDGVENQQKCTMRLLMGATSVYRAPQGDDDILERSRSLENFTNERETVAADVLAGICGSLSSSSCITSYFNPGERYKHWKCQKVGSSTGRPMIPEVTQNVDDDEACSDDSCGEMNLIDWTDDEKSVFIQAVASYGTDFTMISRCVRTRSRDECKVFFSKARKCLGLDMIRLRPGNEEISVSDNANGGGNDDEGACVVEIGSVICSEKSETKIDEDTMMLSDLNINNCESDPAETMNVQTDLNRSEENNGIGEIDCKDPEAELQTDDWRADGKPELHFDCASKMENGINSISVTVQPHENAVLPPGTETGGDEATGEGTSFGESSSVKEANNHGLSELGGEGEIISVGPELEGSRQLASENILSDKQEENGDANTSGSSDLNSVEDLRTNRYTPKLAAVTNAPVEFGVDPKKEKIALELNPSQEPHFISLERDASLPDANSATKGTPASWYEKILNQETLPTLDLEKISDKQCRKSTCLDDYDAHQSGCTVLGHANSCQILRGYPLQVFTKKEVNGEISSKKLASLQSLSKADNNVSSDMFLSRECFFRKCNGSRTQSSVAELPLLSQEQKSDHFRPLPWSSSDTEKPCRNGDVKLFGQILTHPKSQQNQNSSGVHENEENGVQHPKLSSKNCNVKINGSHTLDGNLFPAKLDRNNYLGLENVPMRSSGFRDGNRARTGVLTLPDSAILLAKYPDAFGNYSTLSDTEQPPLHSVVRSNEPNLNGASVFSSKEKSSSNGVGGYQLCRNREGAMKERQDTLFFEKQIWNGFEPVSNIRQQTKGKVGINVVGRGGILVGGACTGVSDPVAAIKMHYAKTEQSGGKTPSFIEGDEKLTAKS